MLNRLDVAEWLVEGMALSGSSYGSQAGCKFRPQSYGDNPTYPMIHHWVIDLLLIRMKHQVPVPSQNLSLLHLATTKNKMKPTNLNAHT